MTIVVTVARSADPVELARHAVAATGLPIVDLTVGAFGVVLPRCIETVFFRLARPVGGARDRARALYLLAANPGLRVGTAGWIDGPGIASGRDATSETLRAEIEAIAPTIRLFGEEGRLALAYLELHAGVSAVVDDVPSQAGANPDLSTTATHYSSPKEV